MKSYIVLRCACFTITEKASDTRFNIAGCSLTRTPQIDTIRSVPNGGCGKAMTYYVTLEQGKEQDRQLYVYALEQFPDLTLVELTNVKEVRRYTLMLSIKYQMN